MPFETNGALEKLFNSGLIKKHAEVWSSGFYVNQTTEQNLLNPNIGHWDSSSNVKQPWLLYRFPGVIIESDNYTVKIPTTINFFIRSWKVFGSMDNESWFKIDEKINNTIINESNKNVSFSMSRFAFSWIRFEFSETTRDNVVYISFIDFAGRLIFLNNKFSRALNCRYHSFPSWILLQLFNTIC